jgi:hypothetical protein
MSNPNIESTFKKYELENMQKEGPTIITAF